MIQNLISTRTSIIENINRCKFMQGSEDIYNYQNEARLRIHLAEVNASIIAATLGINRNLFDINLYNVNCDEDAAMNSFIDTFIMNFENILTPYFNVNFANNIESIIQEYFKAHYTLLPNREEINNNMKTFKITCNIPDEYIFFLMNIHDAIPDVIDQVCTLITSSDMIIKTLFPSVENLVIQSKDRTDYCNIMEFIENYIRSRLMSRSGHIQSYMVDGIMNKFKSAILDTSPMFIFLGSVIR